MHLKISSGKWRPFCLGLNVLKFESIAIRWRTVYYSILWLAQDSGSRLNIKMSSYQYRDSHVKYKTVSRPSYLQHGNPHTWERYWDGALEPLSIIDTKLHGSKTFSNITKCYHYLWEVKSAPLLWWTKAGEKRYHTMSQIYFSTKWAKSIISLIYNVINISLPPMC